MVGGRGGGVKNISSNPNLNGKEKKTSQTFSSGDNHGLYVGMGKSQRWDIYQQILDTSGPRISPPPPPERLQMSEGPGLLQ